MYPVTCVYNQGQKHENGDLSYPQFPPIINYSSLWYVAWATTTCLVNDPLSFSCLKVVPHVDTMWGQILWFPLRKSLHCLGDCPVNVNITFWSRVTLLVIQLQNGWGLCHEDRFSQGSKWSIRCFTLTVSAVRTINEIISIVFI